MTKEQFATHLIQELFLIYSCEDYSIHADYFTKNNNTTRFGIVIRKNNENVAPTIYIDNFYEDYLQKKLTLDEIAGQIHQIMKGFSHNTKQYHNFSMEWNDCQSKIAYRLISKERNEKLLTQIPYIPFLNLAIVFFVVYNLSEQGLESICITEELQNKWEISTQKLLQKAEENTPRMFEATVETMEGVLCDYLGCESIPMDEDCPSIYIFSNEMGINGATVMIYRNLIHDFAQQLQSDLYILPSSIHELLVIPEFASGSLSKLSDMVQTINQTHVLEEEVLSDCAYYYNREEKRFLC